MIPKGLRLLGGNPYFIAQITGKAGTADRQGHALKLIVRNAKGLELIEAGTSCESQYRAGCRSPLSLDILVFLCRHIYIPD